MPDPESRRALLVRLTPKGRRQFNAAAKQHESWVKEFFSVLTGKEKKLLFDLVGNHKAFVLSAIQHAAPDKPGPGRKRSPSAVIP